MISEESWYIEDWSNDPENIALLSQEYIVILNCNNIHRLLGCKRNLGYSRNLLLTKFLNGILFLSGKKKSARQHVEFVSRKKIYSIEKVTLFYFCTITYNDELIKTNLNFDRTYCDKVNR